MLLAAVLAAGCGSDPGTDDVATAQSGSASPSASANGVADKARKYAECMRENGVPDFPDPKPDGSFDLKSIGGNIDREKIKTATAACQDVRPDGGVRPELDPAQQEQLLKWAQCMRDNGVDVPDPDPNGSGSLFEQGGIELDDPTVQKAMEACQGQLDAVRGGGS